MNIYRKKDRIPGRLPKALTPYYYVFPIFVVLLLVFAAPLLKTFIMAFQNYKLMEPNNVHFNGLDNFKKLFSDSDFTLVVKNSVVYVFATVIFQFLFGLTLALALKKNFKGRGLYQAIVFLPWALSGFVVALMFRWGFNGEYGVVNDLLLKLGLISEKIAWLGTPKLSLLVVILATIWMGIPFFAIMLLAALQSIPNDVYEACDVDGCVGVRRFFFITLPYIKPTIITTVLLRTIWVFNSFDLIVVITNGGPASTSQTLNSFMYTRAFTSYDFGMASALGVLLVVVMAIYTIVFLRVTRYDQEEGF